MQQPFTVSTPWFDNTTIAPAPKAHGTPLTIAVAQAETDAARARGDAVRSVDSRPQYQRQQPALQGHRRFDGRNCRLGFSSCG